MSADLKEEDLKRILYFYDHKTHYHKEFLDLPVDKLIEEFMRKNEDE